MRKEFLVERQGKQFVLYAGLLSLGHEQGLKSIRTTLIQVPSEANNRVAICSAVVILERDGVEREFQGIGDAAPNNVAPAMANCTIRLAETRAKARALRDAVNVGTASLEELDEEEAAPDRSYQAAPRPAARVRQASRPAVSTTQGEETGITETQVNAIRSLSKRTGHELPDVTGWTNTQASLHIKSLQATAAR